MNQLKMIKEIEEFGWTVVALDATDYLPSFAYTLGLWKNYQHPEIIAFGLPVNMLHTILNEAGAIIKSGQSLKLHQPYTEFFENGKASFLPVDELNFEDYFNYATELNGVATFPAYELVWTDRNLKFPWEEGFEAEFKFKQPLLDRNANFKFFEEKNLEVLCSKGFNEGQPIVKVIHTLEGDWEFQTSGHTLEYSQFMALEDLIIKDPSLNDLFDLDYGQKAERKSPSEKWNKSLL